MSSSTDGSTTGDHSTTSDLTAVTLQSTSSTTSTPLTTVNVTVSTTTHLPGLNMGGGVAVGVGIGVVLLVVGGILVLFYLRKTGRLKWLTVRGRPRRSSTSSSRHPLEPDDIESRDNLPQLSESDMFSITDHDDADREAYGAAEDGYFYDEVFGSTAFEDETTKASNRDLFSATDTDSIPDLLLRVDKITFN